MVFDYNNQKFGIRTNSPQYALEAWATNANTFAISAASNIATSQWTGIHFGYGESDNISYRKSGLIFERQDAAARGKIHILNNGTNDNSSAVLADSKITVTYDGNVGINKTAPDAKLHVNSGSNDEVARFESTGDPFISLYDGAVRQAFWWSNSSGVQLTADAGKALQLVTGGLARVYVLSTGNVGIRTASPSEALHVTGNILATGDVTAFSDLRIKDNIEVITDSLNKVIRLKGVTYTRKDEAESKKQTGLIAQDLLSILPEAVHGSEETTYSIAYGNLAGLFVEAIKELNNKIINLEFKLSNLISKQ